MPSTKALNFFEKVFTIEQLVKGVMYSDKNVNYNIPLKYNQFIEIENISTDGGSGPSSPIVGTGTADHAIVG